MKKLLYLSLLLASFCYAQSTACNIDNTSLPFTGVATGSNYNNNTLTRYCNTWTLQVWSTGFSAISCQLEGADDNSGTPGAFAILTATPAVGTNPLITLSGVLQLQTFKPWMRVNCTTATGTGKITYRLNGANGITAKITPPASSGSGVTFAAPFVTTGMNVFGPVWALTIPPLTGWSQVNNAAGTFDTTFGYPYLHIANLGAVQTAGISRAAPATPYSVIVALLHDNGVGSGTPVSCGNCGFMFGWTDGTKISANGSDSAGALDLLGYHWNSATSFNSSVFTATGINVLEWSLQPHYYKICDDGTNLNWFYSIDGGNHFVPSYVEARTSFLTSVPSVYFGNLSDGATSELAIISYKTTNTCP